MTAFTQLVDKRANRYQQLFLTPNNNKSNLKLDRKIGRFQVTGREVTLKSRGKRSDKDPILPILRDGHHFARDLFKLSCTALSCQLCLS